MIMKRKYNYRTNSQSSIDKVDTHDMFTMKPAAVQSPMSLAQIISATYKMSPNLLIPHPEFLSLLRSVGAKGKIFGQSEIFTVQQLCFYLKEYIKKQELYDINNVHVVYCRSDPLGKVFGVDRFTIHDVLNLISKKSTHLIASSSSANDQSNASKSRGESETIVQIEKKDLVTSTTDERALKRYNEKIIECSSTEKRHCTGLLPIVKTERLNQEQNKDEFETFSGWKLFPLKTMKSFEEKYSDEESIESVDSIQSKITAVVRDSSDDLWFLEDDNEDDKDDDDDDFNDIYAIEYDVASDSSQELNSDYDEDDEDDDDEDDNEVETKDLLVICNESDLEFADSEWSDKEDEHHKHSKHRSGKQDISWKCSICQFNNFSKKDPFCDYCLSQQKECDLRRSFVSDSLNVDLKRSVSDDLFSAFEEFVSKTEISCRVSESEFKLKSSVETCNGAETQEFTSSTLSCLTSSQESGVFSAVLSSSQISDDDDSKEFQSSNALLTIGGQVAAPSGLCVVCQAEPKVASIIHGSTGHQACCYDCARRLKRHHKPCPVCRRPIEKIVRNYIV